MSTFRSRQRAAQRRQPTSTAERATPPAGNSAQPGPRGDQPFHNKPRSGGDARQDGRYGAPRSNDPRFGADKPRFDKPREGGFAPRDRDAAPRDGGFDKPRFGGDKPRFDKPREGGFAPRERDAAPRDGGFDKPRFGGDKPRFDKPRDGGFAPRDRDAAPRDGGFDKPRFGGDKPRFDKPREGGFAPRDRDAAPRDGGFDKPRFGGDKPRFDKPRDGGFAPRDRDAAPRDGGFDKPRFSGDKPRFDKPRDSGFAPRDRDAAPRDGGFDKPRFGGDKPRFDKPRDGGFAPRERDAAPRDGGFDKPRFGGDKPRFDKPRDSGFAPRDNSPQRAPSPQAASPEGTGPRVLFGNRKIAAEDSAPAAAANPVPGDAAPTGERSYTRDRVAGVRGKAHPDFQAPEPREAERRESNEPVRPKSFLKSPRRDERSQRDDARHDDRPHDAARQGGFQRNNTFDARGQERHGSQREGGFQRDRTFDRHSSQPHAGGFRRDYEQTPREGQSEKPRFGGDKPRFGGQPRDAGFERDQAPRGGFDKPRFGGQPRDAGFERDQAPRGGFDKPRFGGQPRDAGFERDQAPRGGFDKPRFGGQPRDGGFSRERDQAPRAQYGKSGGSRDDSQSGRTPYAKPVQHTLKEGQLALFASCPRGLEKLLAEEIAQQGGLELQLTDGGVHFIGSQEVMMRVNLHSRTASRLLMQLVQGSFRVERDIYTLAKSVDWPALFDVSRTIKVKTDGHARLRSIDYVSLIVKDAICDRFREINDERPSVNTRTPDIRLRVFLSGFDVQIYLDTSGEALFKRGWRDETGEAPLRENLAAGILLSAGYNGSQPLLDPMCGSGTFLVEAADIALNRAPGRLREFAFEKLNTHNDLLWHSIRNDAERAIRPLEKLAIQGNDLSREMVEVTRHNLARCGLAELVRVSQGDATDLAAPAEHGLLVCNPPYGIRLDEQDSLAELYPRLATWLKRGFAGWTAYLMTADHRLPALMRLNADTRPVLYNGALECRVYGFPLVEGSNRKA